MRLQCLLSFVIVIYGRKLYDAQAALLAVRVGTYGRPSLRPAHNIARSALTGVSLKLLHIHDCFDRLATFHLLLPLDKCLSPRVPGCECKHYFYMLCNFLVCKTPLKHRVSQQNYK